MNLQLVVANLILLMFWEKLQDGGARNEVLCKETLKALRARPLDGESEGVRRAYNQLQALATKLLMNYNKDVSKEYLVSQVRLVTVDHPALGDAVITGLSQDLNNEGIVVYCHQLVREIKDFQRKLDYRNHLSKAIAKALSDEDYDLNLEARALTLAVENYAINAEQTIGAIEGVLDQVDFDNEDELREWFMEAKREIDPDEILRWQLKDLNEMCGQQGGGRRKEQIIVAGLQHHFKSGMVMSMVRGAAMYNTPKPRDPSKKPLILLVSTENQMTINLRTLYKQVMDQTYGKSPKLKDINAPEAAKFLRDTFMRNGWHFKMVQVVPAQFGYYQMEEMVLTYERQGYEIILMAVDYLGMCNAQGLTTSQITGRDKQALFNYSRQLMLRHDYIMLTPHQLSTQALDIDRDRPRKFMDEIPNRQFYHDCKTIGQEADLEIMLHKIIIDGKAYLQVARGKHRGVDDTPESAKYFVAQFTEAGIIDDVLLDGNKKTTLKKLPQGGTGNDDAYWEMDEAG